IEDEVIEAQLEKLRGRAGEASSDVDRSAKPYQPVKDPIGFGDFMKVDLRVGIVSEAERVEKSDKLIRTVVDLGVETRQILAGVAEQMEPGDLVGRRVVVVANLEPKKMFGLESQG